MTQNMTPTKRNAIIWIKDAWHLSAPYWRSKNKYQSMGLVGLMFYAT